ncbi:hypothetical protein [Microbulbifer epialgicus]|uniref:Uncharacterized protein n=1 Tax=Microbulbifer epialgicus TaxID=393907 RepID=A0ABV4NTA0_9GAMM
MKILEIDGTENPLRWIGSESEQLQFEQAIFLKAASMSSDYRGGEWRYLGFLNRAESNVFMAPRTDVQFYIKDEQFLRFNMCAESFGLEATIRAMEGFARQRKFNFLNSRIKSLRGIQRVLGKRGNVFGGGFNNACG